MRVLIRNRRSLKYLADGERWEDFREMALDFGNSVTALNSAERMALKGIEIVLDFGNVKSEVVLNVPDKPDDKSRSQSCAP